mmetsp:Transcript_26949/g.42281  ORF Transcript_26949/g.42281 Transcript_26949/m.42281 type:complete len:314 (-) Transcript_26949:329-1270(-)
MNTTAALVILGTLATPTVIWSLTYFVRVILVALSRPVNLKKKYGAEWALVTGGSSGIGKSLCRRLAEQGLNVVVVALEDQLLKDTVAELKAAFPERQFIMVGANLSPGQKYMEKIAKATKDISVQCVFNNAGYIVTGFFEQVPVERQLANVECNATAAVAITHHFLARLVSEGKRGCIVFTSSVVAYMPAPFSVTYGATKAFLSSFASSLAIENREKGIDVCSVHPSPVASRFYDNTHKMEMMDFAKKGAASPDAYPDQILKSVGRCVLRDVGGFAVGMRVVTCLMSENFLASAFAAAARFLPDFKKYSVDRK